MATIDNEYQFASWKPPYSPNPIIEDNILRPGTTFMLFGAAGTWKTMNTFHLAYCIAEGQSWFGYKTRPALVFSHQVESPKDIIQERFLIYREGNKVSSRNVFFMTPDDDLHLDTTYGISEFAKYVEEVRKRGNAELPVVVMIDPLYLYVAGHIADEYEVKKFQQNMNLLKRKYNAAIIIIHHSRLTRVDNSGEVVDLGAEEIMGSSYWNNWLDTIMRVKLTNPFTGSDRVHMKFWKVKNARQYHPGFTVQWHRDGLVPEIIERDIIPEDEPTVRNLT